jgi:hydrogenase maturation protease
MTMTKVKIIGLGNAFAGDDAVGNLVARQLLPYHSPAVVIMEGGLSGLDLIHDMDGMHTLIVIDAIHSRAEAGTIVRLTVPQDLAEIGKLAWGSSTPSTHAFGLGEALTLANTLNLLPQQVVIYGIVLGHIHPGESLSSPVSLAIPAVALRIVNEELRHLSCTNSN